MILSLQMKASERPHNVRHNIIAVLGMLIMSSVATVYAIEAEVDRGVITSSEPLWLSVHMNPPLKCEAISVHVQKDGHAATEIEKSCLFWEWNQRKQTWGVVLQSELVDNRYIFREAGVYTITIQVGGESISKILTVNTTTATMIDAYDTAGASKIYFIFYEGEREESPAELVRICEDVTRDYPETRCAHYCEGYLAIVDLKKSIRENGKLGGEATYRPIADRLDASRQRFMGNFYGEQVAFYTTYAYALAGRMPDAMRIVNAMSELPRMTSWRDKMDEIKSELEVMTSDTLPPAITMLGDENTFSECANIYADVGATATDNKDGDLTTSISVQNNVNPTVPGTYTVVYTVSDAAGNTATATRTVNVVDTTPPVLTCQGAQVHKPETCGGVVNFNVPTALDQCAGSVAVTCAPASGDVLVPGVHTVNCSATDSANNTGTCSFTVDVKERLQVRFVAPLEDDNADNNIETDADVVNAFKVGSRVIHKVKLFDCAGNDVTEAYASLVTVKLDVTLRTTTNTASEVVNDVPEVSSGAGNAGGLMIPVGGHFQYNLDTTGYAAGTVNDGRFYRSDVTVEWVSAPGLAVGGEDALLESKP